VKICEIYGVMVIYYIDTVRTKGKLQNRWKDSKKGGQILLMIHSGVSCRYVCIYKPSF
jgi:hypothetical protein